MGDGIAWRATIEELVTDELGSLDMLLLSLLLDVVREEEGAQDSKHDEELQRNDEPKLLACRGQSSEAIAIEAKGSHEEIGFWGLSRHRVDERVRMIISSDQSGPSKDRANE